MAGNSRFLFGSLGLAEKQKFLLIHFQDHRHHISVSLFFINKTSFRFLISLNWLWSALDWQHKLSEPNHDSIFILCRQCACAWMYQNIGLVYPFEYFYILTFSLSIICEFVSSRITISGNFYRAYYLDLKQSLFDFFEIDVGCQGRRATRTVNFCLYRQQM